MYGTALGQGTYDSAAATKGAALHTGGRPEGAAGAPAGAGGGGADIVAAIKDDHARWAGWGGARGFPASPL
jgi:hypothetical protein